MDNERQHTVGFLGLGRMGEPMARNLLRSGTRLVVWNRTATKVDGLVRDGAVAVSSVEEVFARCRIVICMLATEAAVDEVLGRGHERFAGLVRDTVVVTMGTTAAAWSAGLEHDLRAAGGTYVEAPVSGSRVPAERGELLAMVSGDQDAVELVRPVLKAMCSQIHECGPVPGALTMKLAVNTFLVATITGLAEAMAFAERCGLDLDTLRTIVDGGQMASPISRIKTAKLAGGDLAPQASVRDVGKNARLIADHAAAHGIPAPLTDAAVGVYDDAVAAGLGDLDQIAIVQALTARSA
ncbi:NAD(P)-dependent oxidoreductase [Myceligenerans pegani]|uniref:NAD(P)-dependent oxidoreductase n=1 Tax=Myceligenerans pegani TaxID=2776917 RepID=A0ABR9MYF3_9MICO|nr:NAD(P)-dependent oxidoreductase [Myceligenerans sp. TRM 65318]MBE1876425.1 NAD(P)-dependent oxidoreductase [Myceligenerans sp. TRM 65318]MBE3018696.1 NAD(P)-dependent oxidoreductase [Myceligenerans sp. TRM 65318]